MLEVDADKYVGPHFTKEYRRIQERCGKLERALDKVDVNGSEYLRTKRKSVLLDVDKLAKKLAQKAHTDGICCDECEVKN